MPSTAPALDPAAALRRRAARFLRKGDHRKAILALREASALDPSGASYVRLGYVLSRAGKRDEALHSYKQALYCFRYDDMRGRARTVARLILALDPSDRCAQKRAA
jgi:Flp pilus assembly protein TadD